MSETTIAENFRDFFPEDGDISYEEFLEQQQGVYQSIQTSGRNNKQTSYYGGTSSNSNALGWEDDSSYAADVESQLELDEALARSLQDIDDDFEHLHISHFHHVPVAENRDSTPEATPSRVLNRNIREDDINPDNMTYEQLQSLGEAVGHESKGLSVDIISRLPTYNYKPNSRKQPKENCVICLSEYESGVQLITLPCAHRYHSECIRTWLNNGKTCPTCQVEVKETEIVAESATETVTETGTD